MRIFKVYFRDGNQRLYSAKNIQNILDYITVGLDYSVNDITKIEEV